MSNFEYLGRNVFYEIDGEGKPLIILNGIMMSTKSWQPFIPSLKEYFKVIRLDFLDQGQSDKLVGATYTQTLQVDLLAAFISFLNLDKVNLCGISYGGEVALGFATKYPQMVNRLMLFNTTAYTSPWLQDIGRGWIAAGKTRDGKHYYQTTIPVIYSPTFYEQKLDWMKKREQVLIPVFSNPVFLDQMERLTLSAESYDVRDHLDLVKAPTMIVSAEQDYLTPMENQEYLHQHIENSHLVKIPFAGHASMYEKPLLFTSFVIGFFGVKDTIYPI
ncbi:MAG: alpha/beta fold hydrolase [Candidatus Izemoplasmatales bacterium]